MSGTSVPARADARLRTEMLRLMLLSRAVEERARVLLGAGADPVRAERLPDAGAGRIPTGGAARIEAEGSGGLAGRGPGLILPAPEDRRVPFHVGAGLVATGEDLIVAGRHDTALFLLSGVSPGRILAGLLGRGAEPFAGRDAGLRFAIGPCRLIPTASHDAQGIPVAAGAALAFKREGKGRVALAFFEETSVFRGDFHEGINFAAVQDLPVVYVASRRAGAGEAGAGDRSLVERAVAYDIPALSVDGEDALAVHETVGRAVLRARRGGGPTVVEGLLGAAGGEGGAGASMRRAEEGPVETFARRLAEEKVLDGKAFDAMRAELGREVEEAARWALEQPWPVAGEATEGVRVGLAGGPAVREERTGD